MNESDLLIRIAEIENAIRETNGVLQQQSANLNMLEGGRQECLFWLAKLKELSKNK